MSTVEPRRPKRLKVKGKAHYLTPNRATRRPSELLFLDTETRVRNSAGAIDFHVFRLGVTCRYHRRSGQGRDAQKWRAFDDEGAMTAYLDRCARPKRCLYVFASNPSFDLWCIRFYHIMRRQGWRLKFLNVSHFNYILVCKQETRKICVLASQNIVPVSIARLGEVVGRKKLDCDPLRAGDRELLWYCRRDVEILRDFVLLYLDWCDKHDLGAWAYTLSGQAFNAFRHRFMSHRIYVHRRPEVLDLERLAYKGGRVEAFRLGDLSGRWWHKLDVNSLYPFVMREQQYPVKLRGLVRSPQVRELGKLLHSYCLIADVDVDTKEPVYGITIDHRLCFPTGAFRAALCTDSLRYALGHDHITRVHRVAVYDRAFIFRAFVDTFYRLRLKYRRQGNEVFSFLVKRCMNMLYGKFGQAPRELLSREDVDSDAVFRESVLFSDKEGGQVWTQLLGTLLKEGQAHEHRNSIPAICAHVTDYGRMELYRAMRAARTGGVVYCDTDSLIVPTAALKRLQGQIDPDKLGYLKFEGRTKHLIIYGAKDYEWGDRKIIKGIPTRATATGPDTFDLVTFPGLYTLLDGCDEGVIPIRRISKTLTRTYLKGDVQPGGRVLPFALRLLQDHQGLLCSLT